MRILPRIVAPCALWLALTAHGGESHADRGEDYRQLGAHVHGEATLALVLEGKDLLIELVSPAINLVGFEHAPHSEVEHQTLQRVIGKLERVDNVIALPAGAHCRLSEVEVASSLLMEHEQAEHEHGEEVHESRHDDAVDRQGEGHAGHGVEASHAEFLAHYALRCQEPAKLTRVELSLFDRFAGFEKIRMQWIAAGRQGAKTLSPADAAVDF